MSVKKDKVKLAKEVCHFKWTNWIAACYKNSLTKTFKVKYVTGSHKYKSSTKKVKITIKYNVLNEVNGSYNHYDYGYYVKYVYPIKIS